MHIVIYELNLRPGDMILLTSIMLLKVQSGSHCPSS